jgi:pyruvate-formate lyase-activating enzyme
MTVREARLPPAGLAAGLAYCDSAGRVYFDEASAPLADGGFVRAPLAEELIPAPPGTVTALLPGRTPLLAKAGGGSRPAGRRTALSALLPAGYTRLLVPAYRTRPDAPTLPLFGYAFACCVDDELYVAAMRTDESEDWQPRYFAEGELAERVAARCALDPANRVLRQVALCARDYGCFTAQNVFLERGEAALPLSPSCNARCRGCISELEPEAGIPSPQTRIAYDASADELARVALHHLARVPEGIVSFGQGCEGEPLLRATTMARAIGSIRAAVATGTINLNTNGSLPKSLQRVIDAGLQAVRISLNSFRPEVYAAYYRPLGYGLDDVLESVRLASAAGLRVSLNLLTFPGVSDERAEIEAAESVLESLRVDMVQTRTLNIDPEVYRAAVGPPVEPLGMRVALERIAARGVALGNFTHAH